MVSSVKCVFSKCVSHYDMNLVDVVLVDLRTILTFKDPGFGRDNLVRDTSTPSP